MATSSDKWIYVYMGLLLLYCQQQVLMAITEADDATTLHLFLANNTGDPVLASWNGSAPCTSVWERVVCSTTDMRVTAVDLSGLSLSGTIPSLAGLDRLLHLDLSRNNFTGQLSSMPAFLEELLLSDTRLSGLGALCTTATSLKRIDVSNNMLLQGPLPACWGNLTGLVGINAARTALGGPLPSAWGSLTSLSELDLSHTAWQPAPANPFPISWGNMVNLKYLDLSNSTGYSDMLNGTLPSEWMTGMNQMKTFICHHCKWIHAAHPSLAQWSLLTYLDISYNPLGGNTSEPLLDVSGIPLNRLPDGWQSWNLEVLKVRSCGLTAKNFTQLADWSQLADNMGLVNSLRVLDLGDNPTLQFTNIDALFGQMRLWELYIDHTNVTLDSNVNGWQNLPCTLSINNNSALSAQLGSEQVISDTSANKVCRKDVTLEWTELFTWQNGCGWNQAFYQGSIPVGADPVCPYPPWVGVGCDTVTGRVTSIDFAGRTAIYPSNCTIPHSLFKHLSALSDVSLAGGNVNAHLSGPDAIQFSNPLLRKLDLSGNTGVVGPLSSSWPDDIPSLEVLTLTGLPNLGPFPAAWANSTRWASSLIQLELAHGNLSSALPMAWSLSALQHLDLSFNNLTGSFLHVVTPALQYLDVSMNGLTDSWTVGAPWTTANLKSLFMNNIRMSGSLPGGVLAPPMEVFQASFSLTSGHLPEMPNSTSIAQIQLQGNALNGTIPNSWTSFGTSLGCLILADNPDLCGVVPNGLPCFDTVNTSLGKNCSNHAISVQNYTDGFINVTCRSPSVFSPGCMPATGTRQNPNFQTVSGWTEDGLVLQKIKNAMNLTDNPWPFVTPCGMLDFWSSSAGIFGVLVNGSWQQPLAWYPVGYSCEVVATGTYNESRITRLSLSELVDAGIIPPDKLRLPQEIFKIPYLSNLTSVGRTMFGSSIPALLNSHTHLRLVNLSQSGLSGSLPFMAQTDSPALEYLDVSYNSLTGAVPATIPGQLQELYLSHNQLSGSLPEAGTWNLTIFDASYNNLNGTLPGLWASKAPGLQDLRLSYNKFTGFLPPEWGDQTISPHLTLKHFECSSCGLLGPLPSWGSTGCTASLEYVDLSGNNLTSLPQSWTAFSSLMYLDLSWNQLSGTLFGQNPVCAADYLEVVKVAHNSLSGALFAGIAATPTNYPALHHLDASYNQISGGVPTYLPPTLQQLYLDHNLLTGPISSVFANSGSSNGTYSSLTCWSLDHNAGLCGLAPSNSRCFDKAGTNISYECTTHLPLNASFQCTTAPANATATCDPSKPQPMSAQGAALLAWRDSFQDHSALSNWGIGDPCAISWLGVTCDTAGLVVGLDLGGLPNPLIAYGPIDWQALADISSLRSLYLKNVCSGDSNCTLPTEFVQLVNLVVLNLASSNLDGPLPDSWGSLSLLQELDISDYYGSSWRSIPASWANMTGLLSLRSQRARLSGPIESLLAGGRMPYMRSLVAGDNWDLYGTLPAEWSNRSLEVIDLSNTKVNGGLPGSWASGSLSQSLRELYLHQTGISGPVPISWYSSFGMLSLFTVWSTSVCGPHPSSSVGMGQYCLDTTRTKLGFDCSNTSMPPSTTQTPIGCLSQPSTGLKGPSPVQVASNQMDRETLLGIKVALGSPAVFANWDTLDMPCGSPSWDYVGCSWNGAVSELRWSDMGLEGTIPVNLGSLSALQMLDLSANKFTGLPPSWGSGQMPWLRELNLSSNSLSGGLPVTYQYLAALEQLDVSYNLLNGPIPAEWGWCTNTSSVPTCLGKLQVLQCTSCGLSGSLPSNWTGMQLQQLSLSYNNFSGGPPVGWQSMNNLMKLDLSFNQLTSLPGSDYFAASPVREVNLRGNQLAGTLPSGWGNSELRWLDLGGNRIGGDIPAGWLNGTSRRTLEYINLAGNQITGSMQNGWSLNTSSLGTLILSNNPSLFGDISALKLPISLQALYIANTNISGRFNDTWMGMQSSNFSCLVAHGCSKLCGALPASLPCSLVQHTQGTQLGKDCTTLAVLNSTGSCKPSDAATCAPYLSDASALLSWKAALTDPQGRLVNWTGPDPCSAAQPWVGVRCSDNRMAVVAVNVSGFGLSGALSGNLAQVTRLQVLDVSNNKLTGELPAALGQAKQLTDLNLSNNNFTGALPSAWYGMYNLARLTASNNKFQGGIPDSWGNGSSYNPWYTSSSSSNYTAPTPPYMLALRELTCNRCNLSGSLGNTWANMINLRSLSLADNNITGYFGSFGAWRLEALVLDRNPLQMWLSPYLANWRMLKKLSLSGCGIQGSLPPGWSVMPLQHLDLSFNQLIGSVPPDWSVPNSVPMSANLRTLLLAGNMLTGQLSPMSAAFPYLSCLSVEGNFDICGPAPSLLSSFCGNYNSTNIGRDCSSLMLLGNPTCNPATAQCQAMQNTSGMTVNPSGADVSGLLALKTSVSGGGQEMCAQSPQACNIFMTWDTQYGPPCTAAQCSACTLESSTCGVLNAATNTTTCKWRYVECKNYRVSRIVLDYQVVGSLGPILSFTSLPAALGRLSMLEELHLSNHVILSGTLPGQLASLTNLRVLHLNGSNGMNGTLPMEWSTLANLESLWLLNMRGLSGLLPDSWGSLTKLRQLQITIASNITGPIPSTWGAGMTQLEQLQLTSLGISGALPGGWAASMPYMTDLQLEYMSGLSLPSANITAWLTNPSMKRIIARGLSGLNGMVLDPGLLSMYLNISELSLSLLGLSGSIPSGWGTAVQPRRLKMLDLAGNALSGSLPGWVGGAIALDGVLDVSNNIFTGPLPASWGQNVTSLQTIRLSHNQLSGSIPQEWAYLAYNTVELDVSYNRLQDSLGAAWYNSTLPPGIPRLQRFQTESNLCLCGGVPSWIASLLQANTSSSSTAVGRRLLQTSPSPSPTSAVSPTPSPTTAPSPSPTPSNVSSPSPSPTSTLSPSPKPTNTSSPSPSPTLSTSPAPSPSNVSSPSPSPTNTNSPSMSPSIVSSPSPSPRLVTSPSPSPALYSPNFPTYMLTTYDPTKPTIVQSCDLPQLQTACVQSMWAAEFLQDVQQLLLLKAVAADNSTRDRLSHWKTIVPPCTSLNTTGTCVLCDDSMPLSSCGTMNATTGAVYCNWRYIQCRNRRIVAINMARKGMVFSSLPAGLANGTVLESLDLSYSPLKGGSLPPEYANWANMTTFRLSGNISGVLPLAYTAWSRLQVFELLATSLNGSIPAAYFDSWPLLQVFTIDGASIAGYLPAPWNCLNMTSYIVQNTPVAADAANPVWVLTPRAANLTQMKALGLGGTQLQLPSWTAIKEALKANNWSLTMVSFPKANFTGPVGSLLHYFPQLQMIDLSNNQLSGDIPPDLMAYKGLMYVNLSSNALYGTLPALVQAFALGQVYGLDVSYNKLSGPLPALNSTPATFWMVSIGWNQLEGSIPDSWSPLMLNSGVFDARQLKLSGTLPSGFAGANVTISPYMQKTILFNNNTCLCGPYPAWFSTLTTTATTTPYTYISGSGLGQTCPANCTYPTTALSPHPDWAGLQALSSAIVSGPAATVAAINTTWFNASRSPCHDIDPNCQMCPFTLSSSSCGNAVGNFVGPPSYYCNAQAVACKDGRIASLNVSWTGLVFSQLPVAVGQLSKLQELGLEGVTLNASPPAALWASLPALTSIRLSGNTLSTYDSLPTAWAALRYLKNISVSNMTFTSGGLPEAWANITSLQALTLGNLTFLAVAPLVLPSSWANLTSLTALELDTLKGLSGNLPASWVTGFPALSGLKLQALSGISITSADAWGMIGQSSRMPGGGKPGMYSLVLAGFNLTGALPAALFKHTGLVTLSLAGNQLMGALDSYNWTALSSLKSINMSRNSFTGMLPTAWGALRGNVVIDMSYNSVTGPLPASWSSVGADGLVMPLAYLDVSFNSLTGSLPVVWSSLPPLPATFLNVSHNQLSGSIPTSWSLRNITSLPNYGVWSQVDVSYNSLMCGAVPAWWSTRFIGLGIASTYLIQGTQLTSLCRPTTFEHYFDTQGAYYPTAGRPIMLQLVSKTPFTSFNSINMYTWQVNLTSFNNITTSQLVGPMQQWQAAGTDYIWNLSVPGYLTPKVGSYKFTVANVQNATAAIVNKELTVPVYPAVSLADTASFAVSMANQAVGAAATVTARLNDLSGDPIAVPSNATYLSIYGYSSGQRNVSISNFTKSSTGIYTYNYTAVAMEQVVFSLFVDNSTVTCYPATLCYSNSTFVSIYTVHPNAVDATASANKTLLQVEGDAARSSWNASGPAVVVPASGWHLIYLPVARAGGGVFYNDPGLYAQLVLNGTNTTSVTTYITVPVTTNSTNSTNTTTGTNLTTVISNTTAVVTTIPLLFKGYWSTSNGSYVIAFKIPTAGLWTGQVQLKQSNASSTSIVTKAIMLNVSNAYATAARSFFNVSGSTRAGDFLSITATLKSPLGRLVSKADNVNISVSGSVSGVVAIGLLERQFDGTWLVKFIPAKEETLKIQMLVDSTPAGSQTVIIAGRSAAYLAYNTSLQQSALQAQGLAVTTPVTAGSLLLAYTNETSFISIPVIDQGGSSVSLDPGLRAVVTLIPPPLDTTLLKKYNLTTSNSTLPVAGQRRALLQQDKSTFSISQDGFKHAEVADVQFVEQGAWKLPAEGPSSFAHHRRHLLQTTTTTTNSATANATTTSTSTNSTSVSTSIATSSGVVTYWSDYHASEAPDPVTFDPAPPLPPSNATQNTSSNSTISASNNSATGGALMGPDMGNPVQDSLSIEAGVLSVQGLFDSFKAAYTLQVTPPAAVIYTAVLSLRHPNLTSSFVVTTFQLAVAPNPAIAAAASMVNTSSSTTASTSVTAASVALFNPLLNPRFDFVATFKRMSASSYPGGSTQALDALKAIVAANAALDGPNWVVDSMLAATPLKINATVWFPSTYANSSSPFQGLSALDYFAFLLNTLPTVAFSSDSYPAFLASDTLVENFTISFPGGLPVNGSTYRAAAPATSSDSTSTNTTAAAAITVVNIRTSDLVVAVAQTATAAAAAPPPVDLTKIVDKIPPAITMAGSVYIPVLQADAFTDPGATVYDNIDGNSVTVITRLQLCARPTDIETATATDSRTLTCGGALAAVNTTVATQSNETYVLTYTARDAAGNQALPQRRYVVVNSRCPSPEKWCPSLSACSVQGLCLAAVATGSSSSGGSSSKSAAATYVPLVDKTPPQLKLLGTGKAAITATGAAIMMDDVTWKSAWQDPGAFAMDAVDGNLSAAIQSYGAGAVDTSLPTTPNKDFSYVVEYAVEDKSGNAAPVARRLIKVVCPTGQSYCIDPDTGKATCTVNGICGAPSLLATGTGAGSSAAAANSNATATVAALPTAPRLSMIAPGAVQIVAGQVYDRCAESAAMGSACERGVSADDDKDGNLDRQVLVCGNKWRPSGNQKAVPVLLACGIDGSTPGEFNITFSVTNSAGLTAMVKRRITIKAVCPPGEALCSDKVTCSVGGTCTTTTASRSSASGSSAAAAQVPAANQAPTITLVTTTSFGNIVHVRRGSNYDVCKEGVLPTAAAPCEPGATAVDPDGLVSGDSTQAKPLDKTTDIVACPPDSCLTRGCSPAELRRHYFSYKGLKGCGVDTDATEGAEFRINFWVWDGGSPMLNASVTRSVVIDKPCPDSDAPYYCTDATSGNTFCSGSPCSLATKLTPPAKPQPKVQLLPSAGAVYIQYGKPAPFDVRPCGSGSQVTNCGAVASEQLTTQGRQDLTPYITISQTAQCDSAGLQGCPSCDLAALTTSGNCMPGSYLLTYSVTDDDGMTGTATRRLYVYQAVYLTATFKLYTGIINGTFAQDVVDNVQNTSTSQYAAAANWLHSNLTADLTARMDPTDIVFVAAETAQPSWGSWDVSVTARLYLYQPDSVHTKDIGAYEQSLLASAIAAAAQRRLLAAAGDVMEGVTQQDRFLQPARSPADLQNAGATSSSSSRQLLSASQVDVLSGSIHRLQKSVGRLQTALADSSCLTQPGGGAGSCVRATAGGTFASVVRRRLLQQTSNNTLDALISALQDTMINSMGASGTNTTELTTQQVDVLQVYVSSLTSAVQQLSQQVTDLSTTGTALSGNINLAFGDNAVQRDSNTEVQITTMYQDLITQFDAMVTDINNLADQALAKFDQQAATAATYAASLNDAVTAMRESAALAEALQQKYVQQTLMIDAATGQVVEEWSCDRDKYFNGHFIVNKLANASAGNSTTSRRRSLKSNSDSPSASNSPSSDAEEISWEGYKLILKSQAANWGVDDTELPEQARYIGAAPCRNRLIGGLFLHTTRKTVNAAAAGCSGTGFKALFDFNCQKSAVPLARNATVLSEYLATLFAGDTIDIFPYGVDPAFLRSSEMLHKPELQGHEGWFYNTTDPLEVPPTTGTPYGFFHQPLEGYPSGFPILIPIRTSRQRSAAALQYLLDGNYLDKKSKRLTAELLTYNADLRVIGYTQVTFEWQKDGAITGFVDVRTVPAIKSTVEGGSNELARWLVPLWLLSVAFCITVIVEARRLLAHYDGDRWIMVLISSGDIVLSAATAAIMLASVLLLTVYCLNTALAIKPKAAYEVYDALTSSKARMFMPAKTYSEPAVAAAEATFANSSNGLAAVFDGDQLPIEPGTAGRWLLPDAAAADWSEWATLMRHVHETVGVWAAYTLLQGIILVLLILKLVRVWSFQSKLGVICNTLISAAPQLAHLLMIIIFCIILFACLANIGIGHRVSYTSSYAAAFEETFRAVLGLGYVKLQQVFPADEYQPWPQLLLSILIYYCREVIFVMVLAQYFMATLGAVFAQLKRRTTGDKGTSIGRDITRHVCPELRAKLARLLHGPEYSTTARDCQGAAIEIPAGAEALLAFIKAEYPHLVASKAFGDRVTGIPIGDKYLDLDTFQQVLAELAIADANHSGTVSNLLAQQKRPARAFAQQAAAMLSAGPGDGDFGAAEAAAAVVAGTTEIEVVGAAAAVAAALAAAEQFMSSVGKAVDVKDLEDTRMQVSEALQMAGALTQLRAGLDYTAEDLQAVIDRELELHRQIYSAIWAAVAAMERWSSGVNKWLAKITKDTNSWMAKNAQIAEQQCGSAAGHGVGYVPIPAPTEVDLSESLRPQPAAPGQEQQLQQQQEFGATVMVTAAAAAGDEGDAAEGVRLGANLASAPDSDAEPSGSPPAAGPGLVQGVTNEWVSTTGGGSVAGGRWAGNTKASVSRVSIDLQKVQQGDAATAAARHRLGSMPGWGSIKSPGGVSLHSRAAGTPAGPSGLMATVRGFLGGGSGESSSANSPNSVASATTAGIESPGLTNGFTLDAERSSGASADVRRSESPPAGRPRSAGRAHLNRIAPFDAPAAAAAGRSTAPASNGLTLTSSRSSATVEDLASPAGTTAAWNERNEQ